MLDGMAQGKFQGFGPNGMTNDWKAWDGTPWGYEGLLVDNYYVLLAVLAREGLLGKEYASVRIAFASNRHLQPASPLKAAAAGMPSNSAALVARSAK